MNDQSGDQDAHRSFQMMTALESGEVISQRELASRLGIAVGLVNSYLKHFVAKGYVRVKTFPRNRYAYLLTPKGIAEKSRLAYQHLNYFTSLYTTTRREYLELFLRLKGEGMGEVVFCGIDEVTEIAYLSLQEAGLELVAVVDNAQNERPALFGKAVWPITQCLDKCGRRPIVVTSLKRREELRGILAECGLDGLERRL